MSQDPRQRAVDQNVLSILRASGGWNARARHRLGVYAASRKIETWRIAAALRQVARGESEAHVPGGTHAPAAAHAPAAPHAPAAAHVQPAPHRRGLLVAALSLVVGTLLTSALLWVAYRVATAPPPPPSAAQQGAQRAADAARADRSSAGPLLPTPESSAETTSSPDASAGSGALEAALGGTSTPAAPLRGRTIPPAPAVFPRAPGLQGTTSAPWMREALESLAAEEAAVERVGQDGNALDDAQLARLQRAADAFIQCWPILESGRRTALIEALVRGIARAPEASRRTMTDAWQEAVRTTAQETRDWWRAAGGAGMLQAVAGGAGGGDASAFAEGALGWLGPKAPAVAKACTAWAAAAAGDLVTGWLAALDAAAERGEEAQLARDAAVVQALDALLRGNAIMDRPGSVANAAGAMLEALPWSGGAARRARLAEAWTAWMGDTAVRSPALHGLSSVLAARRPGAWWDPWLVVDPRATMDDRARVGQLMAKALAAESAESAAPQRTLRGIDPELVHRWRAARATVAARAADTPVARLAHSAETMALVCAAHLMVRGRASEASALLAQVAEPPGLAPDEQDRWKGRQAREEARTPSTDGRLEEELRSRRSLADRLTWLRALRTRPIRDLGPLDAKTLAHEALAAASPETRSVAQGVIADTFAQGPEIAAALMAEVASAVSAAEAAAFAASLEGVPAPHGTEVALRAAATLLLADHLDALRASDRHMLDAAARELTLAAAAAAKALGADTDPTWTPDLAMAAWARARAADAQRTVPADTLAPIQQRDEARRRMAQGIPQRFAAAQAHLLELDAAILMEQLPRRRSEIQAVLQNAAAARAKAQDVQAQIQANASAMAELAALAFGSEPKGGAS
ncbi:MAG: hypothetical protein U0636_09920 [Phycisphaerales bacterium]